MFKPQKSQTEQLYNCLIPTSVFYKFLIINIPKTTSDGLSNLKPCLKDVHSFKNIYMH